MQVEMRKREQELLARIKEQQRELDAVKAEKTKVEKQLTRQEREREEERRRVADRERRFEEERERREGEEKQRQSEEREEARRTEEAARRDRNITMSRPHERWVPVLTMSNLPTRVLTRDKASPAHLRGRRPPSLVSSDTEGDSPPPTSPHTTTHAPLTTDLVAATPPMEYRGAKGCKELLEDRQDREAAPAREEASPQRSLLQEAEAVVALLRPPPRLPKNEEPDLPPSRFIRRPSLRKKKEEIEEPQAGKPMITRRPSLSKTKEDEGPSPLVRRPSLRARKEDEERAERIAKIQASPSARRKEFGLTEGRKVQPPSPAPRRKERKEVPSPSATPSLRRKGSIRHTLESLRAAASGDEGRQEDKEERREKRPSVSRTGSLRRKKEEEGSARAGQGEVHVQDNPG